MPRGIFAQVVSALEALAGGATALLARAFGRLPDADERPFLEQRYPALTPEQIDQIDRHVTDAMHAGDLIGEGRADPPDQIEVVPVNPVAMPEAEVGNRLRYDVDVEWHNPNLGITETWTIIVSSPIDLTAAEITAQSIAILMDLQSTTGSPRFDGVGTDGLEILSIDVVSVERAY